MREGFIPLFFCPLNMHRILDIKLISPLYSIKFPKEYKIKKLITFIVFLTFSQSVFSRDSSWSICSNDYLGINYFEHRNSRGDGRVTNLTLLFGAHLLTGAMVEDESSEVKLLSVPETIETDNGPVKVINSFIGEAHYDYEKNNFSLKGIFNLYGEKYPIDAHMECREMNGGIPE